MKNTGNKRNEYQLNFQNAAEKIGLDIEEYMEILDEFVISCVEDIDRLRDAVREKNYNSIANAAHSLKGSAGNMGLEAIRILAMEAENIGRTSSVLGIDQLAEEMEKLVEETKTIRTQISF